MDVDLASRLSKIVHDQCKDVPHDIGSTLANTIEAKDFLSLEDEDLKFILGRPNFWCGSVARTMRSAGHNINENAEDEQAYVIHWMLVHYFDHGPGWRGIVSDALKEMAKKIKS